MATPATVHASAVLVGARAILIRGPAGAGKSRLALGLILAESASAVRFARLVADDRVLLEVRHDRLLARAPAELAGLIELRGAGIRRFPHEPAAAVGLVIDLADADAERLPGAAAETAFVEGIALPRLTFPAGIEPLPAVLGYLHSAAPKA
jgi:HPr kinase/phosphorylase